VPILTELQRRFGDAIVETHEHRGDVTAVVARDALLAVLAHCRDDAALAFDVLMDLTAVDYLKFPGREDGPRFDVEQHAVFGSPHDVAAQLAEHVDAGITKLMLGVPSLDLTHLRRVAHEVAPALRARSAASR